MNEISNIDRKKKQIAKISEASMRRIWTKKKEVETKDEVVPGFEPGLLEGLRTGRSKSRVITTTLHNLVLPCVGAALATAYLCNPDIFWRVRVMSISQSKHHPQR